MARPILPLLFFPGMEIRKAVFSSDGKSIVLAYMGTSCSFRCACTVTKGITQETDVMGLSSALLVCSWVLKYPR